MSSRRQFLRAASAASIAGLLSACGLSAGQPGAPTAVLPTAEAIPPTASAVPTIPSAATAIPTAPPIVPTATAVAPTATAIPPTAVPPTTVPPTAIPPTTVPPTAIPPTPQALLGPEWTVLGSGDLYAIGVETVVAYRPSGLRPGTIPDEYADFRLLADQIVAVQRNAQGQPWVRMLVTPGKAFLNGSTTPFNPWGDAGARVAGYLLALEHPGAPLRVQPLDAQGNLAGQGLVFAWSNAGGQYEVSTLVVAPPPPPQPTLTTDPHEGGPGSSVTVSGAGYTPGMGVVIRLGLPSPIGEVLAVGSASADGRFSATLVLPDRLPSGDLVPEGMINLVAMDGQNRALASTPLRYERV